MTNETVFVIILSFTFVGLYISYLHYLLTIVKDAIKRHKEENKNPSSQDTRLYSFLSEND